MTKFKDNIMLQYTLATLAVSLSVSLILGFLLSKRLSEQAIKTYTNFFPRMVSHTAKGEPRVCSLLASGEGVQSPLEFNDFAAELQSLGSVFGLKIWDRQGNIVWSSNKYLEGKSFGQDPDFRLALKGVASSTFMHPDKDENRMERYAGPALEIFSPIVFNNEVVGVVEFYESAQDLLERIKQGVVVIWTSVIAAGILLYILLFFIFFNAQQTQKSNTLKLERTVDAIIYALAYLAEIRDVETGRHLERTGLYVGTIAQELLRSSPYSKYLSRHYIADLVKSSPLHDVGKVGVSDAILHKPGKLTPEEFAEMQKHCDHGARILIEADKKLGFQSLLTMAIQIAQSHHERWDGKGYPRGISGDTIPLSARIMALADVYDALRSKRCYKEAYSHAESVKIILDGKGTQFDPSVVNAFLSREKEFEKISLELAG